METSPAAPAVLIAYDGSGSTGGSVQYHKQTQEIVSQYADSNTKILFWDHTHKLISFAELSEINRTMKGFGGTSPVEIATWVRENDFHGRLVIITDGEVHSSGVDSCERVLENWTFEFVEAHLIGGSVNMSITCPFTRVSTHTVYLYEPSNRYQQHMTTSVSAEDIDLLRRIDEISSVEAFQTIAEKLETVLIARTMGTNGNMELRDKLLAMKKRINSSISCEAGKKESVTKFLEALDVFDYTTAVHAAKQLTFEYYSDFDSSDVSGSTWSSKVSRMIAMTEGALRGVFSMNTITSGIQSDRVRRAAVVQAPPASVAPAPAPAESPGTFVCPISLDSENDVVLLVKSGEPILADLDKHVIDDLLDCPLNLVKYPELIEKLVSRLDHPISLAAYSAASADWTQSPMTREHLLDGAICFGAAKDHCMATQYTLAKLFTGGKLAGNPDFWYACIWWVLNHNCPSYLESLKPFANTHMSWRLQHQHSFIALSGLPEFPTTRVPLRAAIWYVLASPLFADTFGAGRDVIRGHLPHLTPLLELSTLAGFVIPDALKHHYVRLRTMLRYLSWIKADRESLPMYTRMLIQAHVASVGVRVGVGAGGDCRRLPIDGPASAEQVADARRHLRADPSLSVDELVGIAAMVSPQKSASDIPLSINWNPDPELAKHVIEWIYGLDPIEPLNLTINPKTCRPQYMCGDETWRDISTRKYGDVEKQISVNAYFGKYVESCGAYPNRDALLEYVYNRCVVYGKHTTLPAHIVQIVDEVCSDYKPIMDTITPTEFITRWRNSVRVEDRKRIEA